jgi:hypothetical protein
MVFLGSFSAYDYNSSAAFTHSSLGNPIQLYMYNIKFIKLKKKNFFLKMTQNTNNQTNRKFFAACFEWTSQEYRFQRPQKPFGE